MKPTIALIGPGRVGSAVAKKLTAAGYQLTALVSRDRQRAIEACQFINCTSDVATDQLTSVASAAIILLAVPDDQIQSVAQRVQSVCDPKKPPSLIHFSGLHPASIMQSSDLPATLLSLHPLLPFANREKGYNALNQCPCAIESNTPQGILLGEELATAMGGIPFTVAADKKSLYHAAACISSNYLVTLIAMARDLFIHCGIESEHATPLLLPLMRAAFTNIEEFGVEQGLTGPIVRGDSGTVTQHLQQLKKDVPELLESYRALGIQTVIIGEKSQRLSSNRAADIKEILGQYSSLQP